MKITEQDIERALLIGSGYIKGKQRIYEFFKKNPINAQKFLKKEYGIGGRTGIVQGSGFSHMDYDSSGLRIKTDDDTVELSWDKVAKKISLLIKQDKYLSQEEKKEYNIEDLENNNIEQQDFLNSWANFIKPKNKIAEGQLSLF